MTGFEKFPVPADPTANGNCCAGRDYLTSCAAGPYA